MKGLMWMDFGMPGARVLRTVSFGLVAGRELPQGCMSSLVGGAVRVRRRRLGGRSVGGGGGTVSSRLHHVSQGDEIDAASAQFFVNSSLAPVLLFRRRLKPVADALKGIKQHGLGQTGWDALRRYWGLCVVRALVGQFVPWSPGRVGFLRIFTASTSVL